MFYIKLSNQKIFLFFLIINCQIIFSQVNSDTLTFKSLNKSNFEKFTEDIFVFGGFNTSGIYYSNHFRQLSYNNGFVLGLEKFIPLKDKYSLFSGLNLTQKNFVMREKSIEQNINNTYIEIPISVAIELPVLKLIDFRFNLGGQLSYRINSNIKNNFDLNNPENLDFFIYDNNHFQNFDFGWNFGVSGEYKNFIGRIRVLTNFNKLDLRDQGMLNTIQFEIGYFLFRSINNK